MTRGDFFIIGGKWVAPSSRIQVYQVCPSDHRSVDFLPRTEVVEGATGVVLDRVRDEPEYATRWMNFYRVLFTNGITGLVHKDFLRKVG